MLMLVSALVKLVFIQGIDATALATAGMDERLTRTPLYALRGAITDRSGTPLAFSVEGRAIGAFHKFFKSDKAGVQAYDVDWNKRPATTDDDKRQQVVQILVDQLGPAAVDRAAVLAKLRSSHPYVYLARGVMPAQADAVIAAVGKLVSPEDANAVTLERQDLRQNPNTGIATTIVGTTDWGGNGNAGVETKFNALLAGSQGSRKDQTDKHGRPIPGTETDYTPAVDGTDISLTLDADLQYTAQRMLVDRVNASQSHRGCIVVKGISDGQIYAMSCYEPGKTAAQTGNPAIGVPMEPGSVNKVVTFAAALERKLITPTKVLTVPGSVQAGGRTIHDAWPHGDYQMTATGVLSKSSNVGTLLIADKVGQTPFAMELAKFGLGTKTGIELPGESAGYVPGQSRWSSSTFANLPIGQGLSMTLLQLVDMYQAIGNKGVMVAPTIVKATTTDGVTTPAAPRKNSRVMSAQTAATLLHMLQGTVQASPMSAFNGTGPLAAVAGYPVAGKTGTGQQIDPATGGYSADKYNATFAGVIPVANPKYAIAIWMDAPKIGTHGGGAAAPLFHDFAAYAMRAAGIPPTSAIPSLQRFLFDSQR